MRDKKVHADRGFSLVEILVAVAILAIVVVPLLHSFVTAARTNAKASRKLEATTVAQNVMENLKVEDTEGLKSRADYDDTTGKYHYEVQDQTVNGHVYTAEVTLDPTCYTAEGSAGSTDYNSLPQTELSNLDGSRSACYVQAENLDEQTADPNQNGDWNFAIGTEDSVKQADTIFEKMKRNITLTIREENSRPEVFVTYTYTYAYSYTQSGIAKQEECSSTPVNQQCIFSAGTAGQILENVYLFYEPMYTAEGKQESKAKESIVIDNQAGLSVNIHLIRQENSLTDSVPNAEDKTFVNLYVNEQGRSTYLDAEGSLKVQTTLKTNLSTEERSLKYGTDGSNYVQSKLIQGKTYQAAELVGESTLVSGSSEEVLYRVEISVYEKGETDELAYLSGTKEK